VQTSPSSQGAPLFLKTQPLVLSQPSSVHLLPSSQTVAAPGRQAPPLHASPLVHALLSSHAAVLAVVTQPLILSQASSVQGSPSWQMRSLPGAQAASAQASPTVQASPSSHGAVLALVTQPLPGSQPSSVQSLPSLH